MSQVTILGLCNILRLFTAEKMGDLQMKKCCIFLIFVQNIDCGYMLEPYVLEQK